MQQQKLQQLFTAEADQATGCLDAFQNTFTKPEKDCWITNLTFTCLLIAPTNTGMRLRFTLAVSGYG